MEASPGESPNQIYSFISPIVFEVYTKDSQLVEHSKGWSNSRKFSTNSPEKKALVLTCWSGYWIVCQGS